MDQLQVNIVSFISIVMKMNEARIYRQVKELLAERKLFIAAVF